MILWLKRSRNNKITFFSVKVLLSLFEKRISKVNQMHLHDCYLTGHLDTAQLDTFILNTQWTHNWTLYDLTHTMHD